MRTTATSAVTALAASLPLLLAAACGADTPPAGGNAGLGDEPGGPPPLRAGDPDRGLPERAEMPVDPEEDCGREGGGLDITRAAGESPHAAEKVSFALRFGDEVNPHRLMSAFVMPGEPLDLETVLAGRRSRFRVEADAGELAQREGGGWTWTAPEEPGVHCLRVIDVAAGETMCLNTFVLTPWDGGETLNGYRIGRYPDEARAGYEVPRGLVEVTRENLDTWVSPHFQLRQFLCKQESGWPKYVYLRSRLLLKLEMMLEEVNERGIPARSFYVMSGYRTPAYNAAIGNDTTFSRHTFGDAADVFVDRNGNGVMDDLDGDREVTVDDARVLYSMVEALSRETWYRPFSGGLGLYAPAPHRGPFIHVDTRGHEARW
jgi:hypothetical protein